MEKYMETDLRYLKSLANQYPTVAAAATEIINLQAILSLPKGTEHFITDIHGEYDQFQHVIRNGSGAIKRKIEEEFGNAISAGEKKAIATLIYYPEQKLEQVLKTEENMEDWYKVSLYRLIRICKSASSKYTRSKVRKALPKDFAYVIEELLTGRPDVSDQEAYYNEIIRSVIRTGRAPELVIAFCNLIRRLVVDHLHVVGDIFDRGPYPNLIMDTLMQHHSVDIQWGNHDIYWMGAAAGSRPCICNAIRISAKYGNLNLLEDGYGINLVPLARLAMSRYDKDPCTCFKLDYREDEYDVRDAMLDEKMHKAITVIQFKLEGQMIMRHPEFGMDERLLLDKIYIEKGTVCVEGKEYPMKDLNFPTIDWKHPYELSSEEEDVMERITQAFLNCEKLQRHVRFLFTQGSLYKVFNGNLLYHGCVPMNEDGTFTRVNVYGKEYSNSTQEVVQVDNKSISHTRWKCQYHIVFIPKYRKKVLYGKVREDVREILNTLCKYKNVEIIAGAVCVDHVHLSVAIPPKLSASDFMGYLKGKSTLMLYDRHPELQSKWDKAFWARGYYVETIGNITDEAVQKYIKEQAEESRKSRKRFKKYRFIADQ